MKSFLSTVTTVVVTLGTAMIAAPAMASEQAVAIGKASCGKLANTTAPFILVLETGDDFLGSITQCVADAKLKSASISGLGQLNTPTLAYFTSNPNDKPALTTLPGYYELSSFNGNVTNNAGKYYTHVHAILGDKEFHGIAGHIDAATVGLTVEITIIPLLAPVERAVDPKTGFGPIVQ